MAYIMNSLQFAQKMKDLYSQRDKWTYLLESTGYVIGVDSKVKNYFDYFKNIGRINDNFTWDVWSKQNAGKQCTDCSNTMNYALWGKGCACMYSSQAPKKWVQVDKNHPIVGAVAYKDGHVGYIIDVVGDVITFMHMPSMGKTFETFTKKIGYDDYWIGYAKCPVVEYVSSGTPVGMKATINRELKVGDVLRAEDCTIEITMSDGSKVVNPMNWAASPLKITSLPTGIHFTYKGVSTDVVIGVNKMYNVQIAETDKKKFLELFPNSKLS